jgi:putative endonuclease
LGARGEAAAARYLRRQGYRLLARGQREPGGELDLIALDHRTIVFVEVKTRRTHHKGHPATAVDRAKQRRIGQTAQRFLKRNRLLGRPVRYDVVAVTWPSDARQPLIEHFIHAFEVGDAL